MLHKLASKGDRYEKLEGVVDSTLRHRIISKVEPVRHMLWHQGLAKSKEAKQSPQSPSFLIRMCSPHHRGRGQDQRRGARNTACPGQGGPVREPTGEPRPWL